MSESKVRLELDQEYIRGVLQALIRLPRKTLPPMDSATLDDFFDELQQALNAAKQRDLEAKID